jgi:flagellum-specific peptidoglycan hydrolase FlgJ
MFPLRIKLQLMLVSLSIVAMYVKFAFSKEQKSKTSNSTQKQNKRVNTKKNTKKKVMLKTKQLNKIHKKQWKRHQAKKAPIVDNQKQLVSTNFYDAFKHQMTLQFEHKVGSNLDLVHAKPIVLTKLQKQQCIYVVYRDIKNNYENDQYGVNALAKTAQTIYETNRYQSVLFTRANNIGGQKAFHNEPFYLKIDDKKDCCKGEYPYSRFIAFNSPKHSLEWGCEKILQAPRYAKARHHYTNPQQWIYEVHKAGYATKKTYAADIVRLFDEVRAAIKVFENHNNHA